MGGQLKTQTLLLLIFLAIVLPTQGWADVQEEPDSFDLLGYFPTSESASRISPNQLRISYLSGMVNYVSVNTATDATVDVGSSNVGFRVEADRWFRIGGANRRPFGVMADFQKIYVSEFDGISGDLLRYTSTSLLFGFRFLGYGHAQPWSPEAALVVGAAVEEFPTMRVSYDLTRYRLETPMALGPRVGIRARFALLPAFQMLSLEAAGYVTFPSRLLGSIEGTIQSSETRSMGVTALLDFRVLGKFIVGVGGYYGMFNLQYLPPGSPVPNKIQFVTQSAIGSIRVSF